MRSLLCEIFDEDGDVISSMQDFIPSKARLDAPTEYEEWLRCRPLAEDLVRGITPRCIVELGPSRGSSYYNLCQAVLDANLPTVCFSVSACLGYPSDTATLVDEAYCDAQVRNLSYSAFSTVLRKSPGEAWEDFDDKTIDMLLIDARHGCQNVEDIFKAWTPKLSDRAIILVHGALLHGENAGFSRFWSQITTKYLSLIFPNHDGLGVLFWGPEASEGFVQIASDLKHADGHVLVVNHYQKLGEALIERALMAARRSDIQNAKQKLCQRAGRLKSPVRMSPRSTAQKIKLSLEHRLLTALAKSSSMVSHRAARRFSSSAAKRDPRRNKLVPNQIGFQWSYEIVRREWAKQRRSSKETVTRLAATLADGPVISIIATGSEADPRHCAEMIESVRAQRYSNWELFLTGAGALGPEVRQIARNWAQYDRRVQLTCDASDDAITVRANRTIVEATGQYFAFVKMHDLLDPDALLLVAKSLSKHPDAKIIYSDSDLVSADGLIMEPHFKPDWNRELLYATNYVSSLCVYEASLLRKVGGLRSGYDGFEGYDLLLRCIEQINDRQIYHIPRVLYHFRALPASGTQPSTSRSRPDELGRRALEDHLERTQKKEIITVPGLLSGTFRPLWPIIGRPLVSLILPTRDHLDVLRIAVESILEKTRYTNFELLIVDNGSVERDTLTWLREIQYVDARVRVIRDDRPFNYSALNNTAVLQSRGEILALVNNDVAVISPDWLSEMVALAQRPDVGCVGAKLFYHDDTIQHAGVIVGLGGCAGHGHKHAQKDSPGYLGRLMVRQEYTAVTGACLVVRRAIFDAVGGLNEQDLPVAFNDIDFCLKVRKAGFRNVWTPWAQLYHYESISRGADDCPQSRARAKQEISYMQRVWQTDSCRDAAYNPNLTLSAEDFGIAAPLWNR